MKTEELLQSIKKRQEQIEMLYKSLTKTVKSKITPLYTNEDKSENERPQISNIA